MDQTKLRKNHVDCRHSDSMPPAQKTCNKKKSRHKNNSYQLNYPQGYDLGYTPYAYNLPPQARIHPSSQRLIPALDQSVCHYPVPLSFSLEHVSLPLYSTLLQPGSHSGAPLDRVVRINRTNEHKIPGIFQNFKQNHESEQDYTSLPPVNCDLNSKKPKDEDSTCKRRFSDPGVAQISSEEESGSRSSESNDSLQDLQVPYAYGLIEQVNELRENNSQLTKELHEIKLEMESMKMLSSSWKFYSDNFQPGKLADSIIELREAIKVSEEAFTSKMTNLFQKYSMQCSEAMSLTSSILRQACAFFMRRSFNTDKLYSAVFEQYVYTLITSGDASVEFFIEGTRSRTGKSLMPKYGFLKMALKPYFTAVVPDITILPVSFSYDRVMEERLFAFELLGIPKPKESTKGLLRAYTRILNEKLGYVNVNFGDPISAKEFFSGEVDRSIHNYGPVDMQELTSRESEQSGRLAHAIVRQQQKLTVITCFNLMATVINQRVSESCVPLTLEKLVSEVEWLSHIMTALGAVVTVKGDLPVSVAEDIKLHKSFVAINSEGKIKLLLTPNGKYECDARKLRGHRLSNRTMDIAVPFLMLQFYSNPCAHFLVNLCFVSLIVQFKKTGKLSMDELFKHFQFLRSVFSHEFVLKKETEEEDFAAAFEIAKNQKAVVQSNSEVKAGENEKLRHFCVGYVRLYISSYLMVIDVLFRERNSLVTNERVAGSYQRTVESLMMKNIHIHPASLSLNLVENAVQAFVSMNAIKKIRRKHELLYEISHNQLRMIRNRLGKGTELFTFGGSFDEELKLQGFS